MDWKFRIAIGLAVVFVALAAVGAIGQFVWDTQNSGSPSRSEEATTPLGCTKIAGSIYNDVDCANRAIFARLCDVDTSNWSDARIAQVGPYGEPVALEYADRSRLVQAVRFNQFNYTDRGLEPGYHQFSCLTGNSREIRLTGAELDVLLAPGPASALPAALK